MSKKSDFSKMNEQTKMSEDTKFANTSQLTTVLGDFSGGTGKKVKLGPSALIAIFIMVLLLLGIGFFAYSQQKKISEVQNQFGHFYSQLDTITSLSVQTLRGDSQAWDRLLTEEKSLKSAWDVLRDAQRQSLDPLSNDFVALTMHVNALSGLKADSELALVLMNSSAVELAARADLLERATKFYNKLQYEVSSIGVSAVSLKTALSNVENTLVTEFEQTKTLSFYAAIIVAILVVLLVLVTIRKIGSYEASAAQEKSQLKALVDEWQSESEQQRVSAQERYASAQRVNEANQAAILRLMNELQNLSEGDLTQQATVTEDITGAIADSINYTMEELRNLVSQVQGATVLVSKTTGTVESTSTELLASSDEQLREIRETGQAVLDVAARINNVSTQAQQSASVARQSLDAAEKGMLTVQNSISSMNSIRDQIQDTSKRIKRLVESSQEIGEITDLIADITEQTNILALNAAIQAASAGEAGRGFSIVAEEVQRLAERSAGATRQIASLIKTIQGDMHDAMEAMERSTRGVVEGARQSDETGTAFAEIDSVTRRLASLIKQISEDTLNEARVANGVAESIQHIFAVTEQTANGTRSTAMQVRELARVAEQLERSVARFRIS